MARRGAMSEPGNGGSLAGLGIPPQATDYHGLPVYALELGGMLSAPGGRFDGDGILRSDAQDGHSGGYYASDIARYALGQWNRYVADKDPARAEAFIRHARWLSGHMTTVTGDAAAWAVPYALPARGVRPGWISATTQGLGLSVLVRAYALTGEEVYRDAARRVAGTFALDALDGGICAPVAGDGDGDGMFFEEVAAYPATHGLAGFAYAMFGLYDYVEVTGDATVGSLIDRGLRAFHHLAPDFDTGSWSRRQLESELGRGRGRTHMDESRATPAEHKQHVALMRALARYTGCRHCSELAERWGQSLREAGPVTRSRGLDDRRNASHSPDSRADRSEAVGSALASEWGTERILVPVIAFPVAGGTRSVLTGVAEAMRGVWSLEYMTRALGANPDSLPIHRFGSRLASPLHVPSIWLYVRAGRAKLSSLASVARARSRQQYRAILPQDGLYTALFAAEVGRKYGVRVVCMDHGSITLPHSETYRAEQMRRSNGRQWPARMAGRLAASAYLGALRQLARRATQLVDHFMVAGEESYREYRERYGVPVWRLTRYPYIVDLTRFAPVAPDARERLRAAAHISRDAVVISMINRLSPEKGMGVALRGIADALAVVPAEWRGRIRVLIGGDGPSRGEVEAEIQSCGLEKVVTLLGDVAPTDVPDLLAITDIFLYTGLRGTNYSMAILEAMSAGCAVVAAVEPRSNALLLAAGRGMPIRVNDEGAVRDALRPLIVDGERRAVMGQHARAYVARHHSALALRRSLMRATFWPGWSGGSHAHEPNCLDPAGPIRGTGGWDSGLVTSSDARVVDQRIEQS